MNVLFSSRTAHQALIVVALGFLALALAYSARAVLGLTMPIWEEELGWARSFTSNVAALALIIMAIVAPFSGYLLDRKGLRFTLLLGMVAVCLSCILISISGNKWIMMIGFGMIGGVGFGIIATHVVAAAVARVYPGNIGFASGIATSGSTAGQLLIVPVVAVLLATYSWRWGFVGIAMAAAILIPFIWYIPGEGNSDYHRRKVTVRANSRWRNDLKAVAFNPVFHLLLWSYFICGYTTSGVIETHLIPYASYCGFAPVPSATAYGLLSAANLAGMIGVGWLTDRMNRPVLLGCIYVFRGMTFWLLLNIGANYEYLLLFSVIFGMVDYSTVPVTTSLVASHLGLKVVGFVMGLLTVGHQIGAAIGASLGGFFYAQNASYDLVWVSSIVLAAIAGVLVFLLKEQPSDKNLISV